MSATRSSIHNLFLAVGTVCAVCTIATVSAPGVAAAQETDTTGAARVDSDSVYTIGEITVTSSRDGVHPSRAAQRITVLDQADVLSTSSGSLADLLEARSGLFVRRQGQGLATVSQRGTGPSQTQLLIDGLRLSDPQLGQFDVSLLPTHLFRSVEVLHGPGSALYGTDGLSGVVHLRARHGVDDQLSLATAAGAYGERLASAALSFEDHGLSGVVSAELMRTDGDFPYLNASLFPPREVRRRNADRRRRSLFAMLRGRVGPHSLRGAVLYADSRQGIPPLAGAAPHGERRWDEHFRVWLESGIPIRSGAVSLRTFVHRGTLRYRNAALALDDAGRTLTGGLEVQVRKRALPGLNVTVGGAGGYASADHPSVSSSASELHAAVFSSATGSYGPLRLYPALRLDAYRQAGRTRSALSPRLGANLQVSPRVPLYLKLNAASGFRMPTFNDRFWQPGGNPALEPEQSRSFDAGVYVGGGSLDLELTAFEARYTNQIVWTDETGDYWSPKNLTRSMSRGIEASVDARMHTAVTAGLLYSFTHATDRSTPGEPSYGRQVRYVPRHVAKAYASAVLGPVSLDVDGRYLGRRYVTNDESEQLSGSFVANAQVGVTRTMGQLRARLLLAVENVFDERYAVIQGHPMPPRHARIRLLFESR